jgi:SAM-dependent methyltransferase
MYAYYSLGSASVYKATETGDEEKFSEELKKAIDYFEKSSKEAISAFFSPAHFCLPFYRSYYAVISEMQETEAEAAKYLDEAKKATEGSKSKEALLKAVENLANALKEAHKPDFSETKEHLRACRQHCDRTAELTDSTREKSPLAAAVIMRGIPIVGVKVKEIIAEIQEKAEALCKQTKGTQLSEIGREIFWQGQKLSEIGSPITLDQNINELQGTISLFCGMIGDDVLDVLDNLNIINNEHRIENKVKMLNDVLRTLMEQVNNMTNNQTIIGNNNTQIQYLNPPQKKVPENSKSLEKTADIEPPATKESVKLSIPYLSELESEIADIFKSTYQKDRKPGISEVNAKTLESLKHKLHDLKASGNDIHWLDIGCGDGRCLEVLDDIQDRGNIYYNGVDISFRFLDDAEKLARKYGIISNIEKMNTAAMEFDSEFDLISAVLFLHEVDPLCLPYVIRNMLRALKSDGTLVISDFEGPYEREEAVVSWGAKYLERFLSNIGGARMSSGFVPSGEFPKELGFYRCYVKKPELNEGRFEKFIEEYDVFMKEKKEDSRMIREELRSQINKKVCEILERPDIDLKNISDDEKTLLRESMVKEYGIKALKIRLLTNEILFLDEKISEFERGKRCSFI